MIEKYNETLTPICDFIENYKNSEAVRLHIPGHKGKLISNDKISEIYPYDITEFFGADDLFKPDGIIAKSEEIATKIFGSAKTCYSTFGSTACIEAMLASVCKENDSVIVARNCHKSFMNTAVLLGLRPCFIGSCDKKLSSVVSLEITADDVRACLEENPEAVCVFLTSPDYFGKILDIKAISKVVKEYGKILIIDGAHGAYFPFLSEDISPLALGADMYCSSAHKTLPVLTGGAYIHSNLQLDFKEKMQLFTSTSPSYIIMQSLDHCNAILSDNFKVKLNETAIKITDLKQKLSIKFKIVNSEPLKITIDFGEDFDAIKIAEFLCSLGIFSEYYDSRFIVFMFSPYNSCEDYDRFFKALSEISLEDFQSEIPPIEFFLEDKKFVKTPREAYFSEKVSVSLEDSVGKICGKTIDLCPPCIPLVVLGEKIEENDIKILKNYGIFSAVVLK